MKKQIKFDLLIGLLLILPIFPSCTKTSGDHDQPFDIDKIARNNGDIATLTGGQGFDSEVMKVIPTRDNAAVTVWESGDRGDWTKAKYFMFEIFGNNDYSGVITLEFYKKSNTGPETVVLQSGEVADSDNEAPWLTCLLGINPSLRTKAVFPLSYLDAQEIFIPRSPRQLKGTITGNRLDPADITKVKLKFGPLQ